MGKEPKGEKKLISRLALLVIRGYQFAISPLLGPACRFEPSCSRYATEAFQQHTPGRAFVLTVRRLSKCHPWGGFGYDPVPPPASHSLECETPTDQDQS